MYLNTKSELLCLEDNAADHTKSYKVCFVGLFSHSISTLVEHPAQEYVKHFVTIKENNVVNYLQQLAYLCAMRQLVLLYIMTCLVQEGVSQSCFYKEEYTVIQFMDITILKVKSFIEGFMKRHLTVYSKLWTLVPNPTLLNLYRVYIDNGYTWNYKIAIALSLILVSCLVRHFSFSK